MAAKVLPDPKGTSSRFFYLSPFSQSQLFCRLFFLPPGMVYENKYSVDFRKIKFSFWRNPSKKFRKTAFWNNISKFCGKVSKFLMMNDCLLNKKIWKAIIILSVNALKIFLPSFCSNLSLSLSGKKSSNPNQKPIYLKEMYPLLAFLTFFFLFPPISRDGYICMYG